MPGLMTSSLRKPTAVDGEATLWRPEDFTARAISPNGQLSASTDGTAAAIERDLSSAYNLGVADGRQEAQDAERIRLRSALRAADEALAAIHANEERWSGGLDENIAALAVAVARHIIDREITSDRELVAKLVRRALSEFPVDQPVRIRVNPNDLAVIELQGLTAVVREVGSPTREAQWTGDPRIEAGGCVVEGRDRIIDGRVDTALERTYRRLASLDA
jgi:flagellar biosynthesis/type III secretory pathway protein FliH